MLADRGACRIEVVGTDERRTPLVSTSFIASASVQRPVLLPGVAVSDRPTSGAASGALVALRPMVSARGGGGPVS
jgi:hypothetical protein